MINESFNAAGGKNSPTREQIELAAYYLYVQNGHRDGAAEEHWLKAEQMLSGSNTSENDAAVLESGGSTKKKRNLETSNQRLMGSSK